MKIVLPSLFFENGNTVLKKREIPYPNSIVRKERVYI
jgi:hypothetical protein